MQWAEESKGGEREKTANTDPFRETFVWETERASSPSKAARRLKRKLEKRMKEIWRLSKTFHRPSELFSKTSWGWHEQQNPRCQVSKQSWCVCSQSTQSG